MADVRAPRSFELDNFQAEAIAHLDERRSVVVSAPTGSGKTFVAEYGLALAINAGQRGIYTTPIKALSNQKFRDLRSWLGVDNTGLLTGDNSINPGAGAVVMTTEVLRNMLYSEPSRLNDVGLVVMDEVHYLQDNYRGPVWEEVIIHLPSHIRLVALSATVSNTEELAAWISSVHAPCAAVTETTRPVELHTSYAVGEKKSRRLHIIPVLKKGRPNPEGRRFDIERRRDDRRNRGRQPWRTPRRAEVIEQLERRGLLPAITFIFSRAGCEDAVSALRVSGMRLTDDVQAAEIHHIVEERCRHLNDIDRRALGYSAWMSALEAGIAAHHAGMVPLFKETVEELFAAGLLKAVFATETLALGINMPARTVVIEKLSKFTGEHHENLTPSDFTQLTGRAGRRGIDDRGEAIALWTPFTPFDEVAALARSSSFELRSAFRPTYNMACHLVERYTRDEANALIAQSFGQFQADRAIETWKTRRDQLRIQLGERESNGSFHGPEIADRNQLEKKLAALRPGDVVDVGHVVVVLSATWRKGRSAVRVLDREGNVHGLDGEALDREPVVVTTLELPEPFDPHSESQQRALVGQLRGVRRRAKAKRRPTPAPPAPWVGEDTSALRKELRRTEQRIAQRRRRLSERFSAVVGLLTELGYIREWTLTESGRVLLGTFHELDLVIVESLTKGHFDGHDAPTLAGIVATVVFEPRSAHEPPEPWFPTRRGESSTMGLLDAAANVQRLERAYGLPESRDVDPSFFAATHAWASDVGLGDILADSEMSGGDFVRAIKQVIDVLSQLAIVAPEAATRSAARSAVDSMQRGIVDVSFDDGDAE